MSTAVDIAKSVFELLGKGIARELLGDAKQADLPTVEAAIKRAVADALAAGQARLEAVLRQELEVLGLALAIRDLADKPRAVLDAFEPDGSVPDLGLVMEVVGPDEKLEETTIAPVEDPEP